MTYAIYFESVDGSGDSVQQSIFIPHCRVSSATIHPTIWTRVVSITQPARTWTKASNQNFTPVPSGKPRTQFEIVLEGIQQLDGISSHIRGLLSESSWTLRGSFPVFLTDSVKLDLVQNETRVPVDLATSIRSQRGLLSWPDLPKRDS